MSGRTTRLWRSLATAHPARTVVTAFASVILAGTALLSLRLSSQESGATGIVPSLFTATSAVCVTGLAVVDTGTYWSGFGEGVILAGGFGMALAGFTVNPVVTSLAVRFGGDAPTLTSALTTSGHNTGIAAGSLVAGRALDSSLGLTGPARVGTVFAALTLLPLIALALRGTTGPSRIVAHHTTDTAAEPAATATATATTEYGSRGVRINAVCPGTISTPMVDAMVEGGELDRDQAEGGQGQAIDRLGTAEEVARAVLWLCNDGASYVTGVALPVDGGYTAQ